MKPDRRQMVGVAAAVVALVLLSMIKGTNAFGSSTQDPRLTACGVGLNSANVPIASFELPAASKIWDYLPELGISPELSSDNNPAFVVVFQDGFRITVAGKPGNSGIATLSGVVCVIPSNGVPIFYSEVSRVGFHAP
jgi:hypothetical protein